MYSKALTHTPKENSACLISLVYDWRVSTIQQIVGPREEADLPMQCIPAGCLSSFLIALLIALFHLQRAQHMGRKTNGQEPALTPPILLT